jgi:SAM-dependent methyltransferase
MEGWHGWDEYAAFYDWENARTLGRRDLAFWTGLAERTGGRVLELGCGTGRILAPILRAQVPVVGVDRSAGMLQYARGRLRRARLRMPLVRADIRDLPFGEAKFDLVIAGYGVLQSLLSERDLRATLEAVRVVCRRGARFGVDLVPDVTRWKEYDRRTTMTGRRGNSDITLIESVRQDRARRLTIFDQEYVERRGRQNRTSNFSITFRSLSVRQMCARLEKVGFRIEALLGDYNGGPWDERADVWVIVATKK